MAKDSSSVYQEKSALLTAAELQLDGRKEDAITWLEAILIQPGHQYRKEAESVMKEKEKR